MRCQALLAAACAAAALGGCATLPIPNVCLPPHAISPDPPIIAHEEAPPRRAVYYDEPAPTQRLRLITRRTGKTENARKEALQPEPERYSQVWLDRQDRLEEAMKPKLIICRGC
jgi:hypothetical protein